LKKYSLILLFFCLTSFLLEAQDTTNHPKKIFDNRYGPFHQTIKDTIRKKTVSTIGVYVSFGFGPANDFKMDEITALISCSIAYKSHLFTFTRAGSGPILLGGRAGESFYRANYVGLLFGESVRFKYAMLSMSTGLAVAHTYVTWFPEVGNRQNNYTLDQLNISLPIELKAFLLASGGIGFGVHIATNIISPAKYSPFYFGISLVLGKWNKKNNKVDNAFYKESVR
jgi:hypothetical protein